MKKKQNFMFCFVAKCIERRLDKQDSAHDAHNTINQAWRECQESQ